jgi:hypothetical protein
MKNIRLQIELSESRVAELKRLMDECHLSTQKELFNSALTLFEWAVNERRAGRSIASIDESTMKYKELAMPALQAVQVTGRKSLELGAA